MSQQPISTRSPLPSPPRTAPTRPALRVVTPAPRQAGRAPFVVLCSLLMSLGLMALLALNLSLASGSYALHDITARAEVLRAEQSELEERVALQQTPARLAARATELGMVASGTPAYLRLTDGAIIGTATPAPTPTPEESASAGASGPSSAASGSASGSATRSATGSAAASASAPKSRERAAQPAATVGDKPGASASASGTAAASEGASPARGSATRSSSGQSRQAASGTATTH